MEMIQRKQKAKEFVAKITSRKFLLALVGVISGLATAFSGINNEKIKITGYTLAGLSAITYMIIEGRVDVKSVANTVVSTVEKIETVKREDN
jgi:hypothetical protein